ncbi:MAG: ATP-binding protein [Phycisphaerae bacterium]|nr:ATP-binding protein [Phycisphaerae bacterium]
MRTSIPIRLALVVNLVLAALGVAVAWVGISVSGQAIERRLVEEAVVGAASLVGQRELPVTDSLMQHLEIILGSPLAAVEWRAAGSARVTASSLPDAQRKELEVALAASDGFRAVRLGGAEHRVGRAVLRSHEQIGPSSTGAARRKLFLLVREDRIETARREVSQTIALYTVAATLLATLITLGLAMTVSRPLRKLADRIHGLAVQARAGDADWPPPASLSELRGARRGPAEVMALGEAFDELLSRLHDARRQLARSSRLAALGQLSASVAHELRNPLSGIKMNARVLADEMARRGMQDQSLDLILREIDRTDRYLQELMDLTSTETTGDNESPDTPHADLAAMAESVLQLQGPRMKATGVQPVTRFAPPTAVRADDDRIRRVILNLVLNALDAMPNGGTLTLATDPRPGNAIRFSVTDTGGGIRVPEGTDVFEPFVTTKPHGTGLGLHISRRVITRFGGRIDYATTPAGSTFWFELPAEKPIANRQ